MSQTDVRNKRLSKQSKLSPIETFRVRFWYEDKVQQAGGLKKPRELEKYYESVRFKDDVEIYKGKWYDYQFGLRKPQKRLVNFCSDKDSFIPDCFWHPIWSILKLEKYNPALGRKLYNSIRDYAFTLKSVLPSENESTGNKLLINLRIVSRLVKWGTLDSLAVLVLYWLESFDSKNLDLQQRIAIAIYRFLLMVEVDTCPASLIKDLFDIFKARIFEKSFWEYGVFCMDAEAFLINRRVLHYQSYKNHENWRNRILWQDSHKDQMWKLLKSIDYQSILDPYFSSSEHYGPPKKGKWYPYHTDGAFLKEREDLTVILKETISEDFQYGLVYCVSNVFNK